MKTPAAIFFRYGYNQTEIGLDEALFGLGNVRLLVPNAHHQPPNFRVRHPHPSLDIVKRPPFDPSSNFPFDLLKVFIEPFVTGDDRFNLTTVELKSPEGYGDLLSLAVE